MKFITFAFIYFFASFAFSADTCDSKIEPYVIRGDLNATYVGARLWRLDLLKKDASKGKACAKEIFSRATTEADQYWTHIDAKYNCGVISKDNTRNTSTCSDSMNDNVLSNKAYLTFVKIDAQPKEKCLLSKNDTLSRTAQANLKDTSAALQKFVAPSNKCDKIPLKDRVSPTTTLRSALEPVDLDCLSGLLSGFFKEGIFKSIKSIWNTLKDPWGALESLKELAKALIKDPKGTMIAIGKKLASSFYDAFLAKYENFDCYNRGKKAEIICSSIGQGAAVVVEALLGAQAFKFGSKIIGNVVRKGKDFVNKVRSGAAATESMSLTPSGAVGKTPSTTPNTSSGSSGGSSTSSTPKATAAEPEPARLEDSKSVKEKQEKEAASKANEEQERAEKEKAQAEADAKASAEKAKQEAQQKKEKEQNANRNLDEENRIRTLTPYDDIPTIVKKLGLPASISQEELVKHFRKLNMKYSPDREKVPRDIGEEMMKIINRTDYGGTKKK